MLEEALARPACDLDEEAESHLSEELLDALALEREGPAGPADADADAIDALMPPPLADLIALRGGDPPFISALARRALRRPLTFSRILSELQVGNLYVARTEVVEASGRCCFVLTWTLRDDEVLLPKYKGIQVVRRWVLVNVKGEESVRDIDIDSNSN